MPSLEQMSGVSLGGHSTEDTALIEKCKRYSKAEIADVPPEGIRILIGQGCFLSHTLPIAIALLEEDVWFDAGFYKGDLLKAVLSQSATVEATKHIKQLNVLAVLAMRDIPRSTPSELLILIREFTATRGTRH